MKKRIALILVIAMILQTLPIEALAGQIRENEVQPVIPIEGYTDVNDSMWYFNAVSMATEYGMMSGIGDNKFDPEGNMSRAMFVTILGRMIGLDVTGAYGNCAYTDVDINSWYGKYVQWACENGITNGIGSNDFNPEGLVTRQQMAVFAMRFLKAMNIELDAEIKNEPADISEVSSWAKEAILLLWNAGLLEGDGKGHVMPNETLTRAQAATFGLRLMEILNSNGVEIFTDEVPFGGIEPKDETGGSSSSSQVSWPSNGNGNNNDVDMIWIRFVTNGGEFISPMQVESGNRVSSLPLAAKKNETFLGWFIDEGCTQPFYSNEPITRDTTLYAAYKQVEMQPQSEDDTFTLIDQAPDIVFELTAESGLTEADILQRLTLNYDYEATYVTLEVQIINGVPTVSAVGGFVEGAMYNLNIGSGLTFLGKEDHYRNCSFSIYKAPVINLGFSESLKFIDASGISRISRNNQDVDELWVSIFGNDETVEGHFEFAGAASLSVDDLLCIYEGVHPCSRQPDIDYSDSPVAYIRVTRIAGQTVYFVNLNNDEVEEVLFIPDVLPLDISGIDHGDIVAGSITVANSDLDFSGYSEMNLDGATTVDSGDFMVFYEGSINEDVSYVLVESVTESGNDTTITFVPASEEDIQKSMDYYTSSSMSGEDVLAKMDVEAVQNQIAAQVIESGFADVAMKIFSETAMKTDGYKSLLDQGMVVAIDEDGRVINDDRMEEMGMRAINLSDDAMPSVTVILSPFTQELDRGIRAELIITSQFDVEFEEGNVITIDISVTFTEEIDIRFQADGSVEFEYYCGFIPYINELNMSASVDIYDFTSIDIKVYAISGATENTAYLADLSSEMSALLATDNQEERSQEVQKLFNLYQEILENETDYVTIVEESLFEQEGHADPFFIIAYSVEVKFVVKANVNILLHSYLEYSNGTRYTFWFKLMSGKSGSNKYDIANEYFGFEFYVIGMIGLKAGLNVNLSIGLFTTKLGSIGLEAEFGPYVELYGYFVYQYSQLREANTVEWSVSEEMLGALYIDFGLYFELYFVAEALDGEYEYSYCLYEWDTSLFSFGEQMHVYDFTRKEAQDPTQTNLMVMLRQEELKIPDKFRTMKVVDLETGALFSDVYEPSKYYYSVSSKYFSVDDQTGIVRVNVPEGVQYLTCDITLTWKLQKLACSSKDLTQTIHVVWTNLPGDEIDKSYLASVCVSIDGEESRIVWSKEVRKNEPFDLPDQEEVLELLGYGDLTTTVNGQDIELVYGSRGNYERDYGSEIIIFSDTDYYYNIDRRIYLLPVEQVQNSDGTIGTEYFATVYGEAFNLSGLHMTGTSQQERGIFTAYTHTVCNQDADFDVKQPVNETYAVKLLEGSDTFTASYTDSSCDVLFHFKNMDGIVLPSDFTVVGKGQTPVPDTSHLSDYNYIVTSWDKEIGPVQSDINFTAFCERPEGSKHVLTVHGVSDPVETYERYYKEQMALPVVLDKETHFFDGWYIDEACEIALSSTVMPDYDLDVYAKWSPKTFDISFVSGAKAGNQPISSIEDLAYGSVYGTLEVPTDYDHDKYRFEGWFTLAEGGQRVTSETVFMETEDQTLYAQYADKVVINRSDLRLNSPDYYYEDADKSATLYFKDELATDFTLTYIRTKDSNQDAVNESGQSTPTLAGAYIICVKRDADDTYAAVDFTYNEAMNVLKSPYEIEEEKVTVTDKTYCSITVEPLLTGSYNVTVQYAAQNVTTGVMTPWTDQAVINGLTSYTDYVVHARVEGDNNYHRFEYIASDTVKTEPIPIVYVEDIFKMCTGVDGWNADMYYRLENDIDYTDPNCFRDPSNMNIIGGGGSFMYGWNYEPLTGIFDGNGYTLSNGYKEIIGSVDSDGLVTNLTIEDWSCLYAIAFNNGTIRYCHNVSSEHGALNGALVGQNSGYIERCSAEGNVRTYNGVETLGLIASENSNGTIMDCYSDVTLDDVDIDNFGGIVATNGGIIERCSAIISGEGEFEQCGGIVGINHGYIDSAYTRLNIINGYGSFSGEVPNVYLGGIAGQQSSYGSISNSYALGIALEGAEYCGAITGGKEWENHLGNLSNNYSHNDYEINLDDIDFYIRRTDNYMGGELYGPVPEIPLDANWD